MRIVVLAGGLALASLLLTGCVVEHAHMLTATGPSGRWVRESFWPPPPATSTWSTEAPAGASAGPSTDGSFGTSRDAIARALREAGYLDARWYAVGSRYEHGFAVTTRVERIRDDGAPSTDRWLQRFPEASNLYWLENSKDLGTVSPGRYRVYLVAYTDLPLGWSRRAPVWNEQTVLSGDFDALPEDFPAARRATPQYRVGVYVYEFASSPPDEHGEYLDSDPALPASAQVKMSGLGALGDARQ